MTSSRGAETKLVSVVSAVYNEEDHIEQMITSLLEQDYSNWELIIVDDGSNDRTSLIAKQAAEQDTRIRLFSAGRRGKVASFNLGYSQSIGEVIMLLGGDDVLPSDSISTRVRALDQLLASGSARCVAFGRLRTFSTEKKFHNQVIPRTPKRGNLSGGTFAMTRPLAEIAFPVPSSLISEDLWLVAIAIEFAEAQVHIPDIVLNYRIHPGNSNPRAKSFGEMTTAMNARNQVYNEIVQSDLPISPNAKRLYAAKALLEEYRYSGKVISIFRVADVNVVERLRALSMCSPSLFRLRKALFRFFSGW